MATTNASTATKAAKEKWMKAWPGSEKSKKTRGVVAPMQITARTGIRKGPIERLTCEFLLARSSTWRGVTGLSIFSVPF